MMQTKLSIFHICYTSFLVCFINFVAAQSTDPTTAILPPNPNSASLTKYVDFPVNTSTGIPSVSVPIGVVTGNGVSLAVSLDYHAGGVQVDQLSSTVGLGWFLNAGGSITRTVIGKRDEDPVYGFMFHSSDMPVSPINTNAEYAALQTYADGTVDGQPDQFQFSFGGYSGKFIIENLTTVRLIPKQDLKITFTICTSGACTALAVEEGSIVSFTVTTPDGIQYLFGTSTALETSKTTNTNITGGCVVKEFVLPTATSWLLKTITNPRTTDVITLNYTAYNITYESSYNESYSYKNTPPDGLCGTLFTTSKCLTNKSEKGQLLSSVVSSKGKIEFTSIPTRTDLNVVTGNYGIQEAKIYGANLQILKSFQLRQATIPSTASPANTSPTTLAATKKRMYLDTLVEYSSANAKVNTWSFEYYNRTSLPPRLSYKQDHWGYFNNKNNTQLSPLPENSSASIQYIQSQIPSFSPADRNPDQAYAIYGNIKKITYPTGGSIVYEYESNELPVCNNIDIPTSTPVSVTLDFTGVEGDPPQTQTLNFTIDFSQTVTVIYNVQQNGEHFEGAYVKLKRISPNTTILEKGHSFTNPIVISGSSNHYLTPGTYQLEAKVFKPAIPGFPVPFNIYPDHAFISLNYVHNVPTYFYNKTTGGIRLKKSTLTAVTGNSPDIIKVYKYNTSSPGCTNASSAVSHGRLPLYLTSEYYTTDPSGIPCDYALCHYDRLSSNSFLTLTNQGGSIVTYAEVWENQGLNAENGKKYFRHQVFQDGNPLIGPTPYNVFLSGPKIDYSWKNGKVVEEKSFNALDQITYQKLYEYEFNETPTITKGFVAQKVFNPPCTGSYIYYCDGENNQPEEFLVIHESCGLFDSWCPVAWTFYFPCFNQPAGTQITQTDQIQPYAFAWYDIISQFVYLKKTTERIYDSNGSGTYVETVNDLLYDTPNFRHFMPIKTITTNSDGSQYATQTKYPPEYTTTTVTDAASVAIKNLQNNYVINSPVEKIQTIKKSGTEYVTGGQVIKFKNFTGNQTFANEEYNLGITTPILLSSFPLSSISGGNFGMNSNYYQVSTLGKYDTKGNLQEWNKKDDQISSFIYGQNLCVPTAYVKNALSTKIAYNSFEEPNIYTASGNGNWAITPASSGTWNSASGYPQTGRFAFNLASHTLTVTSVPAGKYIVSFWHRDGTVSVNGAAISTTTSPLKYAETSFTFGATSNVTITGTGYIDEVRLFPADALMRTFTYDYNSLLPLNFTDENSVSVYYQYDRSQRLRTIKDQDRNILQTYEYNYQQAAPGLNDIKSRTVLTPVTDSTLVNGLTGASVKRVFQCLDGLGRPIQSNAVGQSPTQNDVINYQIYDAFGREPKKFIPYTIATNNGAFRSSAASEQNTFANTWGAGGYGYSETRFEASPLNRPLEQAAPGATWHIGTGHTKEILYHGNLSSEAVHDFFNNNIFADNKLLVSEELDENERKKLTYSDKLGRVVMVKQQLAPTPSIEDDHWSRTYTVYDDFGRVVSIIPPETAKKMKTTGVWTVSSYPNMVYNYVYDSRSREISHTVPCGGTTTTAYDKLDRPVLVTDANGFKIFTRYDILSRPVVSGRYKGSASPGTSDPLYEIPNTTAPHYYSTTSFPTDNNLDVYKVFYYDDYDLDNNGSLGSTETYTNPSETGYDAAAFLRTLSKPTATKVAILKADNSTPTSYLTTRTYYDKEYSVIQINKQNHLSGADITSNGYDFANRLVKSRRDHTATPPGGTLKTYTIREEYIYDFASRLRFTRHKINANTWVVTSAPVYDELGRLADKRLHASNYDGSSAITLSSTFNYLQSLDYTYNIRNWMTGINDVTSCSVQSGDQLADMFKLQLNYDSPVGGGTAQYNGNISTMQWGTYINSTCLPQQQYRFTYDAADRLTGGDHYTNTSGTWTFTNNYTESNIGYDLNGNIKTYTRRGLTTAPSTFGTIDQLTYYFDDATRPDLLTRVVDAGSATKGFKYLSSASSPHYTYDNNGNLTLDKHKDLTYTYNYLNLPKSATTSSSTGITFTYTADGEKLSKVLTNGTQVHYVAGIEYNGANLEAIYHAEGRCTPNGATAFNYQYTLKDHLGNARVNFQANGNAVTYLEDFHYYPFGMLLEGIGSTAGSSNKYRFNGKELNEDFGLNLYDYGARWYDPSLGRWGTIDPRSRKYTNWSPYNYVLCNPLSNTDPNGDTTRVEVFDQNSRPQDNGTAGNTYTAEVYVFDTESGDLNGPYSGSSYPNSKPTDNSAAFNTLNEGTHDFNNKSGHKAGTQKGLNIDDSNNGSRTSAGTDPSGNSVTLQYINVHAGYSDKGNYDSRGSTGCLTICPGSGKNQADAFFKNFNWTNPTKTTGNSSGKIQVSRISTEQKQRQVQRLEERATYIKEQIYNPNT